MKKKKILFFVIIFFILTTYNFKQNFQDKSLFFPIKEIEINNTFILDAVKVKDDLNYLMNRNLLFLEKDKILETIRENKIIANVEIKKIYPNKLIININEKEIIARYIKNKKNHYILNDGSIIENNNNKISKKIPVLIGSANNFLEFYNNLKEINFPIKDIKGFYFFDIGRFDIKLEKNIVIKLPTFDYKNSLRNYLKLRDTSKFNKYNIFDYRIENQLILN